jgi:DNA-binding SARP family transcriptional activator
VHGPREIRLRLLDGFELLSGGRPVRLPPASQRLVAFLAIRDRPLRRIHVAATLWLDASEERSRANLRSALWRLSRAGAAIVEADGDQVCLGREVVVDVPSLVAKARRLLDGANDDGEPRLDEALVAGELLPDWYDDWVLEERDRVHQLRLHALEALAERLAAAGRYGEAVEAAIAAVRVDLLRESAQRTLIRVHLAEGNRYEALRRYCLFRDRLQEYLGLSPSPQMEALVAGLQDAGDAAVT